MNIAAELISPTELKFLLLESSWENTTHFFDQAEVKVDLAVFFINGICAFYNASTKPEPHITHPSLNFCKERLTVANFKAESKVTGETEPYEVLLSNDSFTLRKEFENAYTLIFRDIYNNLIFARWIITVLSPTDIQHFLKAVKKTGRYYTDNFSEFEKYSSLAEFTRHLLENWWIEKVKGFEKEAGHNDKESADYNNSAEERYKPITFY